MVLIFRNVQEAPMEMGDYFEEEMTYQDRSANEIETTSFEEGIQNLGQNVIKAVKRISAQIIKARNKFGMGINNPKEKRTIALNLKRVINSLERYKWTVYTSGSDGLYFEDKNGVLFACKTDTNGQRKYKSIYLFEGPTMDSYEEAIQNTVDDSINIEDEFIKEFQSISELEVSGEYKNMEFGF